MIKFMPYIFIALLGTTVQAQPITLNKCQELARINYPIIKQYDLVKKSAEYSLDNAGRAWLPQFGINGQVTYQNEVVVFPKGSGYPELAKDQYRIGGEASQLIYDGGNIKNNRSMVTANEELELNKLEEKLYQLKDRINNLFFGILLLEEQMKQNQLVQADIESGIRRTQGALENGTAFRSELDELKASLLNTKQNYITLSSTRQTYLNMLSAFIQQPLDTSSRLQKPAAPPLVNTINRPELKVYSSNQKITDLQNNFLHTRNIPKVSAFIQANYGRPTYNFVSNDFGFYWIGGLKLNWNLTDLYTSADERSIINNNIQKIEADKETFLFNTRLDLQQSEEEISKLKNLLETDEEIISLRRSVKKSADAQLENGVITPHDYLVQVHEENLAVQNFILHQVQLLKAQYQHGFISGN